MKRLALFALLAFAVAACDCDSVTAPACRMVIKTDTTALITRLLPDGSVIDYASIKVDTLCQ